jgi:hypothetical protein
MRRRAKNSAHAVRSLAVISVLLLDIFVFAAQFFYSSRTTTRLAAANLPETKMSAHQKGERQHFFISEGPHISKSSSSSGYIDPGCLAIPFRAKHLLPLARIFIVKLGSGAVCTLVLLCVRRHQRLLRRAKQFPSFDNFHVDYLLRRVPFHWWVQQLARRGNARKCDCSSERAFCTRCLITE